MPMKMAPAMPSTIWPPGSDSASLAVEPAFGFEPALWLGLVSTRIASTVNER